VLSYILEISETFLSFKTDTCAKKTIKRIKVLSETDVCTQRYALYWILHQIKKMTRLPRIGSDKTKTRIIGTRRIETLFYWLTALE